MAPVPLPYGTAPIPLRSSTLRYGTLWYGTVRSGTVRSGTLWNGMARYALVRYGTAPLWSGVLQRSGGTVIITVGLTLTILNGSARIR